MKRKMYPVYCRKCKDKLLEGAPKDSSTYCPGCGVWTDTVVKK